MTLFIDYPELNDDNGSENIHELELGQDPDNYYDAMVDAGLGL